MFPSGFTFVLPPVGALVARGAIISCNSDILDVRNRVERWEGKPTFEIFTDGFSKMVLSDSVPSNATLPFKEVCSDCGQC